MPLSRIALVASLVFASFTGLNAADSLELDSDKSKIEFVGKKSDGAHSGGFKKFTTVAIADFEEPKNGTLTIEIDATSLFSDDEKLTSHLKNPDFFDVRKFPTITFKSNGIEAGEEEGKAAITGTLTMLDKKAEIKVPCTVSVDEKTVTVDATFVLDRTRWGMTYGEGKIDNNVDIKAHLVFNR
jgi:polyisoprenoid-binding protein YceI